MMLEELRKCLKNKKIEPNIFDIVLYGSSVKGKEEPNDIDLIIIFKYGMLKERLSIIQKYKQIIKTKIKLDIKSILVDELFNKEFFARSGIFFEGISLLDGTRFSGKIGFDSFTLFSYDMKNKNHAEKVRFNYLLSGRKGYDGILKMFNGKRLNLGLIQLPVNKSDEFEDILKNNNVIYSKMNILKQI